MMNVKSIRLPYFGSINSISTFDIINNDEEKYYSIKRYDINGKERKEEFSIPINRETTRGIMADLCRDLNGYLRKNKNKYIEFKNKKRIFNLDVSLDKLNLFNKLSKMGICLGAMLIGITFSVVSISLVFYMGMAILVASGLGMVIINDISKEVDEIQFIKNYENYSSQFIEYSNYLEEKLKNKLTEYNGLVQEKNMGNNLLIKKVKALK